MISSSELVACGYSKAEALAAAEKLSAEQMTFLAACALTWYDSPWSDKSRDLYEGILRVIDRHSTHRDE